ncbi:MAG: Phosphoribosylaminoimidazolecarboxamide formyltransferase [Bacteroidota bacterium]|jgi:phosphoribosylaminoimidazolecarboxamide formyltransferase/IMP cyclohydrolase
MSNKKIESALISVFYKDGLEPIIKKLHSEGVTLYSTGGTQKFIEDLGIPVKPVEGLTGYPSIFGGRVKTLHPKVFGGILYRRGLEEDVQVASEYEIPSLDLVMVDLYPFEETVKSGASEDDIIEKIDIGGIALIRGAAKNFEDVVIISSRNQYGKFLDILNETGRSTSLEQRRMFAKEAFLQSSSYDRAIHNYFAGEDGGNLHQFDHLPANELRYGENPHQKGVFYGNLDELFDKLHGKELSYNNLVDVDACLSLLDEFNETAFVIIKHTNACGVATGNSVKDAYLKALSCDPVSAFGGVLATNQEVDVDAANEINSLFCEILIAPSFTQEALEILKSKKNRILLKRKPVDYPKNMFKTLLNGVLEQDKDNVSETISDFKPVTNRKPTNSDLKALEFALKICKHTKSNTIVLAKEGQLLASGVGQTSRVDALKQAIEKAKEFGFDLQGSVMASDAFFPFPDCVEIAHKAGIIAVTQPGGSIKDQNSIDYCNENDISMVFTGIRHFKH